MEKLFAALIPVICVMTLGPLCCNGETRIGSRVLARARTSPMLDTPGVAADRESSL